MAALTLITRERDRLLRRTARAYGLGFTVLSLLCLLVPGVLGPTELLAAAPLYLLLIAFLIRLGASPALGWVLGALGSGLGAIVVVGVLPGQDPVLVPAILNLAAGGLAGCAVTLVASRRRIPVLVIAFFVIGGVAVGLTAPVEAPLRTALTVLLGWTLTTLVGVWVVSSIPQVSRRIASIGRAHRAERQASELEAQRRQGARLLHDTVLATLTLLAHSGVGVSEATLRQQVAEDAALLRQLRLGMPVTNPESPGGSVDPTDETALGTSLDSVKQRFGRMGLEVAWHGTGQVLLPSTVLDAFLLALAECLENVRRHSGVTRADVTITEDATTVRALVTDAGIGFEIGDVGEGKLGFAESVVARLRDVGGNARLYSTPGAGTTVALEVPR